MIKHRRRSHNPTCHDGTAVGRLIAGLGSTTKEQDVLSLAALDEKDKAQLDTLKTDLGTDPAKVARRLETLMIQLHDVTKAFEALQNAVGDEQVSRLTSLHQAYQTTQAAAAAVAGNIFADEPLPDIGSEVWRALWETARRYSEQHAYLDTPFPFTGDAARCVLCQQELDPEAADRLNRFEGFVRDETKRKEEEAATAYQSALDELATVNVPAANIPIMIALIRDELNDNELATSIRRTAVMLKWRLRKIHREHTLGEVTDFPVADAWPGAAVTAHTTNLSERITALRMEDESEARNQMRATLEEFVDREWLAVIQQDIISEIRRRKKRAALNAILKDTATNRITTKSVEIAERLVTNALRAQFSKEIDKFDIAGLAIELRKENPRLWRTVFPRQPDAKARCPRRRDSQRRRTSLRCAGRISRGADHHRESVGNSVRRSRLIA